MKLPEPAAHTHYRIDPVIGTRRVAAIAHDQTLKPDTPLFTAAAVVAFAQEIWKAPAAEGAKAIGEFDDAYCKGSK